MPKYKLVYLFVQKTQPDSSLLFKMEKESENILISGGISSGGNSSCQSLLKVWDSTDRTAWLGQSRHPGMMKLEETDKARSRGGLACHGEDTGSYSKCNRKPWENVSREAHNFIFIHKMKSHSEEKEEKEGGEEWANELVKPYSLF